MSDEKKRYRVKIKNSKDNLTYVPFPDLCVKYTNGYAEPLRIKEGEEIPLSACNPEDVRKSFLAGSLFKYLNSGFIEEFIIKPEPKPPTEAEIKFLERRQPVQGTGDIPLMPTPPKPVSDASRAPEVKPSLPEAQSTLSNFSLVKSYEDFSKLSYFLKLRFIKESNNKELLKIILEKTDSAQFKNNISLRLPGMR